MALVLGVVERPAGALLLDALDRAVGVLGLGARGAAMGLGDEAGPAAVAFVLGARERDEYEAESDRGERRRVKQFVFILLTSCCKPENPACGIIYVRKGEAGWIADGHCSKSSIGRRSRARIPAAPSPRRSREPRLGRRASERPGRIGVFAVRQGGGRDGRRRPRPALRRRRARRPPRGTRPPAPRLSVGAGSVLFRRPIPSPTRRASRRPGGPSDSSRRSAREDVILCLVSGRHVVAALPSEARPHARGEAAAHPRGWSARAPRSRSSTDCERSLSAVKGGRLGPRGRAAAARHARAVRRARRPARDSSARGRRSAAAAAT